MRCKNCPYSFGGSRDPLSDVCDGCTHDSDTGWGGFTDHSVNRHFNNDSEANSYYNNHKYYGEDNDDYYDEDNGII